MQCVIYKSLTRNDTYLFIEREDDFSRVPQALLDLLGQMEFVMELELTETRSLAQVDPDQVCKLLAEQGYYVQLPRSLTSGVTPH